MAVDNAPYQVIALSFHIGLDPHSGHNRTAHSWIALDDDAFSEKWMALPASILRNVCILWLLLSERGGATFIDAPQLGKRLFTGCPAVCNLALVRRSSWPAAAAGLA